MTSNIGSQYLLNGNNEETRKMVELELKSHFKPEFINRIDEVVMFNSLDHSVVYKIIDKFMSQLSSRLKEQNIKVQLSDKAKDEIVRVGFDSTFGARPIKRFIQSHIETLIARELIKGNVSKGDHIIADFEDTNFIIKKA